MLPAGERRIVSGRVEIRQGKPQMAHPDHIVRPEDRAEMPEIEPVYPLTAGLTPKALRRALDGTLDRLPDLREWTAGFDPVTRLADFKTAMRHVHAPQNADELAPRSKARCRLAFDELLANQLALALVRHAAADDMPGRVFAGTGATEALMSSLPFAPTGAQTRAIGNRADQQAPRRMLRMLQGDVGSRSGGAGGDAAWWNPAHRPPCRPTKSLRASIMPASTPARPHGHGSAPLLGQGRGGGRKAVIEAIEDGSAKIVIGTHALISEGVIYKDLGLAVVDEQHRFGVRQPVLLGQKGEGVMSS